MSEAHLKIRQESGGQRHYIGDAAMHAGDPIDAFMAGRWHEGRYEASWSLGQIHAAYFYYVDECGQQRAVRINETTVVRLPLSRRARFAIDE